MTQRDADTRADHRATTGGFVLALATGGGIIDAIDDPPHNILTAVGPDATTNDEVGERR